MGKLLNLARMTVSGTPGTGTITLAVAVPGHITFALAGILDGDVVTYAIEDGNESEIGVGTYTSSGTTLSRDTVLNSTNSGAKISATNDAEVFITAAAEDVGQSLISSVTTSSSQASVSFTSIPQHYKDLIVTVQGRFIRAGQTSDTIVMRFNNDSGNNYRYGHGNGTTGTMTAVDDNGIAQAVIGSLPASTATANYAGQSKVEVMNYKGTTFFKTYVGESCYNLAATSPNSGFQQTGGQWDSTAAITRLDVFPLAGTGFVDGSVVALYGRR